MIADMMTAPNGDLWVSASDASTADSWIGRFDGGRWTIFGADDGLILDYGTALAAAPDGSIWAATAGGLARFDGAHWSVRYPGMRFSAISIAPDGTVWVTGPTGIERLPGPHRP